MSKAMLCRRENPWPESAWPLKVTLGQFAADEIRTALKRADVNVSGWADDLIGRIGLSDEARGLELVPVLDRDLGFDEAYTTRELLDRAIEHGYGTCPPEAGPLARLVYSGHEWLLVAMEPVTGSDGGPRVFRLNRRDDGLWLYANDADPDSRWSPGSRWLLVRREP
ncbi:MAG: hypothetical protein U9Q03_05725 [Patescibacteria group bacterium]|nr:hypothetical protein [Patescibacteria group bacterium]